MAKFDLYTTRKRAAEKSGQEDIYKYDEVPYNLRVQIQQIFTDAIGPYYVHGAYEMRSVPNNNKAWEFIKNTLCREYGIHRLCEGYTQYDEVMNFIETEEDNDRVLDATELAARCINEVCGNYSDYDKQNKGIRQDAAAAIEELNYRFRAAGIGYQFEHTVLIRMDSLFIHEEVIKPALKLLSKPGFSGPQQEFLEAHRYYRAGKFKDAVTWAGKAFESTMKAICDQNGWTYKNGARASDLLKVLRSQEMWPSYLDNSFDQLVATLSSGLPQVRNNEGAHGDGGMQRQTPGYIAAYAIHLAAAKAVFMINAAELN